MKESRASLIWYQYAPQDIALTGLDGVLLEIDSFTDLSRGFGAVFTPN